MPEDQKRDNSVGGKAGLQAEPPLSYVEWVRLHLAEKTYHVTEGITREQLVTFFKALSPERCP